MTSQPEPGAVRAVFQAEFTLRVNGGEFPLRTDARVTLLDALRDRLGLSGTKKGCDQGTCGARTVHVDGKRILSCLTLAAQCDGPEVTTIGGVGDESNLHPVQESFLKHDGFQCGYRTPGQIMSALALMSEGRAGTPEEIRESMSGNIALQGGSPPKTVRPRDLTRGPGIGRRFMRWTGLRT
ncbi:(2Fe-2S)-binding protein [Streptomyces violaceusniger]|uniref:(2Fe-2S)-binding protein n=1 Tax=Streptomyces violaceusniger TaxID=68280 RepID=UPI00343E7133